MNPLNHTLWSLSSEASSELEDLADAAKVDLVGRLAALAPDRCEEECPGVAVAGVAVTAQADSSSFCLQLPLFTFLLLLSLPVSFVSGSECCYYDACDNQAQYLPCEEIRLTASGEPASSDLNDWRILAPL